ncbi:f-box domain-containing protein [Caerostris extrusa]|uniref:F-box domain-containing protein n=1 Tax=Caerostris extrusa TaxID=172846 RepID=A0AAV4XQE0_CAEEX|nr:f-box domain-containing protein [Caerostris extrusa]
MQSCLRKLRILRLGFPFVYQSAGTYKDIGFPDLETFAHPSKEDLLDEFYFRKLLDLSPNLTELDVRGCARLTCTEMCSLPSRNVRKLYISHTKLYCSDVFLCILVKWCRNLVLLDISGSKEERINHHFWWVFIMAI